MVLDMWEKGRRRKFQKVESGEGGGKKERKEAEAAAKVGTVG